MRYFKTLVVAAACISAFADDADKAKVAADVRILEEIKTRNAIVPNLRHLSDVIGPRLTGSPSLEIANNWAADKFREYGLTNVKLEPYEIPIGWSRGTATLSLVEPTVKPLTVASAGWSPGTAGSVSGPVVLFEARTRKDLEAYKGKLKGAILLRGKPATINPVSDTSYGPGKNKTPKDEPKAKKDGDTPSKRDTEDFKNFHNDLGEFMKREGVFATLRDSGKPHGLLVTTGGFKDDDDRIKAQAPVPSLYVVHEHYALLYRLLTEHKTAPKVMVNITNTFSDAPVTVYNTVGELTGSEKPDEIVVLGAHIDSWDLASGTTDNGTGTSIVIEAARTLSTLAKQGLRPKRTIRFVLFSGEEQGLHGSKNYVKLHKPELEKHSAALVHDTGTGKVLNLRLMGRTAILPVLGPELESLKAVGFEGLIADSSGGTDHLPFEAVGVPGFPCKQDIDEYRFTHHTQSDTFDKAKPANLVQGAQVLAVTAYRIANLEKLLPREKPVKETAPKPSAPAAIGN